MTTSAPPLYASRKPYIALTSSCKSASIVTTQSHFGSAIVMPAHSAFMWPALCASFTPSNRASDRHSPATTSHVLSRLPSSTSRMRLSGAIAPRARISSVSSVRRLAVIGSASSSL